MRPGHIIIVLIIVSVALIVTASCARAQLGNVNPGPPYYVERLQGPVPVLWIKDGDTVELPSKKADESVRLIGIDAPETSGETEPYGPEASAFVKKLLTGQEVYVQIGVETRDRYERVLAYLYLKDPQGVWEYDGQPLTQVNLEIVRAGFAEPLSIPPNVAYSGLYVDAAREARRAGRGMWAR